MIYFLVALLILSVVLALLGIGCTIFLYTFLKTLHEEDGCDGAPFKKRMPSDRIGTGGGEAVS